MSEKISYNSSSDSIAKAIGEEFPKAIRWHTKHEAKREWREECISNNIIGIGG